MWNQSDNLWISHDISWYFRSQIDPLDSNLRSNNSRSKKPGPSGICANGLKWDEKHVQLAVQTPNCIKSCIKSCSTKKTNEPDLRMLNERLKDQWNWPVAPTSFNPNCWLWPTSKVPNVPPISSCSPLRFEILALMASWIIMATCSWKLYIKGG